VTHPPEARLGLHLSDWLGRWPPAEPVDVVGSVRRERPGWDGRVLPVLGVGGPDATMVSIPPRCLDLVRGRARRLGPSTPPRLRVLMRQLPLLLGRPGQRVYSGVFRWSVRPAPLPDAGVWVAASHASVPEWLRPFGPEVLVAWDPDTGAYLAGVGLKHHDRYGREIAVGTEPAARGRGLARRLVAQAARRVLDEGAVPTYQHDPVNIASARVADTAGFPDRGWRSLAMF
jgi:GNAT superfamily N-acetyltransferase